MATTSHSYREQAVAIGADAAVVGITTQPDGTAGVPHGRPAIIFINAGVLHRVGPHRLHVSLARRLAEMGYFGLRIDLSGIGDSRGMPGTMTFRESSVSDIRATMDQINSEGGASRFILFGLCSGADNALATACADARVAGIVLLDPPAYPTFRSKLRKMMRRARRLGAPAQILGWVFAAAARRLHRGADSLRQSLRAVQDIEPPEPGRVPPPRQEFGAQLSALSGRGTRVLCIYSGANDSGYNDAGQFFEWFPALRLHLQVLYFPRANHVFTEVSARRELMDAVCRWCSEQFG